MHQERLFSPNQVGVGSFLGGPLAAVYLVWANFRALDDRRGAVGALVWGILFIAVVMAILPFLPEWFPNIAIPVVYTIAARFVAETLQMRKEAIAASDHYDFQTNWLVAGVAAISLAAFVVLVVAELLALDSAGIMPL